MNIVTRLLLTSLACLALAASVFSSVPKKPLVEHIVFEDKQFKNCVYDHYDGLTRLEDVRVLDCEYEFITSAAGVEKFPNLEVLELSRNQLKTLDVSANTKLRVLKVSENALTELDISSNTALENLWAVSNRLRVLDTHTNIALTDLYIFYNQLTSLDLQTNTALTNLHVSYNRLTSLDLHANTDLTTVSAAGNKLSILDISSNRALYRLSVSDNRLTSLDVSTHVLEWLDVRNNQLTTIRIKDAEKFAFLDVSNNPYTVETQVYLHELFTNLVPVLGPYTVFNY